MRTMILGALLAAVAMASGCGSAERASAPGTLEAEIVTAELAHLDRYLREEVRAGFSGAVLVVRGEDILLHKAYGAANRNTGRSMTITTPIMVASISKAITAAAIMRLVDRGQLRLGDTLSTYFPEAPADKRAITVEQLLAHTSGLPQGYGGEGIADRSKAARAILATPLAEPPGTGFGYSNDNYGLLAMIVEIASGQAFDGFIRQEIFVRAGMSDSAMWGDIDIETDESAAPLLDQLSPEVMGPNWGFRGSTGVLSTPRDLYHFFDALRDGRLVGSKARKTLMTPATPISIGKAGYGWFATRSDYAGPALWTRGNESFGPNAIFTWYSAPDVVIVVTSNAGEMSGGDRLAYSRFVAKKLEEAMFSPAKSTKP